MVARRTLTPFAAAMRGFVPVAPVRLQARVVHRMESPPDSPPGNLLAGMGVQFLDVDRAIEQLRSLLR